MKIINSTGSRGKVIGRNASALAEALAQGATSMSLSADAFSDGDTVTIGEEDLLITTAGLTCTGLTRGENSTDDSDTQPGRTLFWPGEASC